MRTLAAVVALAVAITPLTSLAAPSPKAAALAAGDWRKAAELGASAAEVIRAAQTRGQLTDVTASEAVVTIGADNALTAVAMKPLPPLPAADPAGKDVRTVGLSGTGFAFGAKAGSITLYPPHAQGAFAPGGAAPTPALWR